jgi:hypothetical protein
VNLYVTLVELYNRFLALFPGPLRWLVTLIVLIGLIMGLVSLIRHNWWFLVLVVLLLPFLLPVLRGFFMDLYAFILYLLTLVKPD